MSDGSTPPPGDENRPDPTQNPEERPSQGYGSPPPPPPQYGAHPSEAPPPPAPPTQPGYGNQEGYRNQEGYGNQPGYGQQEGYGQQPPPPPAYQQSYGAAPSYTGPYEQSSQVGTLAQWPQRALGGVIDFIALAIPGYILSAIGGPKVDASGRSTGYNIFYFLGILYFIALAVYNRWYKGGTTGQTIGRGVAGVTLVKESTGQPIGMGMAFVRDIAHIVDSIICYVGWLFPLWDTKRQTLADKIVSTVVVTTPKR